MSKPVADLIFGEGSTNIILRKPWSPSTGMFPDGFSEGFVYIAEDDGTVNTEDFTEGDSIIYKDGTWIRFGSASGGGGGVALETYTPTTTDVNTPPTPVTDGTYNGKVGAKVITQYGSEVYFYPAPPIGANFTVSGNSLSLVNGANADGIGAIVTDDGEYPPMTIDVPVAAYFSINAPVIANTYSFEVMFGPKMVGFDDTAIMGIYNMPSVVIKISSGGVTFEGSPFGAIIDLVGSMSSFTGINNFGAKYTLRSDETMDVELYQQDMSSPVITFTIIENYALYYGELDELAVRKGTFGAGIFLNSDNSDTFNAATTEIFKLIDVPVAPIGGALAHWNGEGVSKTNDPLPTEKYSKILEIVSPPSISPLLEGEIVISDDVGEISPLSRSITGTYTPVIIDDVAQEPDATYNGTFFEIGKVENTTGILSLGNYEAKEKDVFGLSPSGTYSRGLRSSEDKDLVSLNNGRSFGQTINVTISEDLVTENSTVGNTHNYRFNRLLSNIIPETKGPYTVMNYYGSLKGDSATNTMNEWELDKYIDVFNGIDILSIDGANLNNNGTYMSMYEWQYKPMLNIPTFNNTFLKENTNETSGIRLISNSSTDVISNNGIVIGDNNNFYSGNLLSLDNGAIKGDSVSVNIISATTTAPNFTNYNDVTTTSDGSGDGLTVSVTVNSNLYVVNYFQNGGSEYVDGDTITVSAAQLDGVNDFVFKVYNTVNGKVQSSNTNGGYVIQNNTSTSDDVYPYVAANTSGTGQNVEARISSVNGVYTIEHWVNKGIGLSIGEIITFPAASLDGVNDFVLEVKGIVGNGDTRRMKWGNNNFVNTAINVPSGVTLNVDFQGNKNEITSNTFHGAGTVNLVNVGKSSVIVEPTVSFTGTLNVTYVEDATSGNESWVTKTSSFATGSEETYILESSGTLNVSQGSHDDGTVLKFLVKNDPVMFGLTFSGFGVTITPVYRDYITLTKVDGVWYKSQ